MLLLRLLLIVPAIIANEREWNFGAYVATTNNGTLTHVQIIGQYPDVIKLSNLGLLDIEKNAFDDHLQNVLKLDLSNNWLTKIPELVFVNFTRLTRLSLADNDIKCCLENVFVGMEKLQVLDLRNNHLTHLEKNYFFGLKKTANIFIDGNHIEDISMGLFENPIEGNELISIEEKEIESKRNIDEKDVDELVKNVNKIRVKICYNMSLSFDGLWVKRVDIWDTTDLPKDCAEADLNQYNSELSLRFRNITNFDENWYGLKELPITSIDLTGNGLVASSGTTLFLNNLPKNVTKVDLSWNAMNYNDDTGLPFIRIDNMNLRWLNLRQNGIDEIETGAFERTNLTYLDLSSNNLTSIKFIEGLPSSLVTLDLHKNNIDNIPAMIFSKLHRLVNLHLNENKIVTLSTQSLRGLFSLQYLNFENNNLVTIEPGLLKDLKYLKHLDLSSNSISNLQKGSFFGLENLEILNMHYNQLRNITSNTFYALPDTLMTIYLDGNGIEILHENSFVRVPKRTLSLAGNGIEMIEDGSFDLPSLRLLRLDNNRLETFESWGNLEGLESLSLFGNDITAVKRGATRSMHRLNKLDLSSNPITRLDNGALPDLPKIGGVVLLNSVAFEVIQAGVFDVSILMNREEW